jgi:hypothetical protein
VGIMETMSITKTLSSVRSTVSASRSYTEEGLGQDERDQDAHAGANGDYSGVPTPPLQVAPGSGVCGPYWYAIMNCLRIPTL